MIRYPFTKRLSSSIVQHQQTNQKMTTNSHNLAKLFSQRPGDLLTTSGGAATHAYFQSRHLHLHHKPPLTTPLTPTAFSTPPQGLITRHLFCSCVQQNGNGMNTGNNSSNSNSSSSGPPPASHPDLDPDTKRKLDNLKAKLASNVYFEKYRQKFQQLEVTSPKELLAKLEQLDAKIQAGNPSTQGNSDSSTSSMKAYALKDVMEVDLLKDLERDDIIYLWQEFHRKKAGVLGAVMASSVFDKMADLASTHPIFLLPLPRADGYEFFYVQYMMKSFHFTPLLVYQTHKENAPECLRLINYTDLQNSKDLVLMRGEYDKNLLTPKDAHVMAVQINFYYGETSESRRNLLETFSSSPKSFHHMDLIDEFNKLKETHPHLFELEDVNVNDAPPN